MKPSISLALGTAMSFALASAALAAPPTKTGTTAKGSVLTDTKGMTLYTFDKDVAGSGKSTCNGGCAALWPPAMAAASDQPAGAYTIVMRDDGARQWAYKGKPVYTYQADQKPGDRAGDNFKDVWHIIKE